MATYPVILSDNCPFGVAGQRVNLELTPSDVHDPTELPTFLSGYRNAQYRADEMSKVVLVDKDSDSTRSFSSDDAFEPVRVKGALTGPIPEVDPRSSLSTYKVVDRFVGSFISSVTEANSTTFSARQAAARRCANAIYLDRELDICGPSGLLTTAANYAAAQRHVLGAGENWNGGAASDPINALQKAIEDSAQPVSEIWMNQKVGHALIRHPAVRDHMRSMLGDGPSANIASALTNLASTGAPIDFMIPGLPAIKICAAKYKNTAGNLVYVFPDVVSLVTSPPGVPTDGEEVATSYTFRRRGPSGVGYEAREFFIEGRGPHGGTMVLVAQADIGVMTGNNCGGIITGVIV